jgi:hypothetical protein
MVDHAEGLQAFRTERRQTADALEEVVAKEYNGFWTDRGHRIARYMVALLPRELLYSAAVSVADRPFPGDRSPLKVAGERFQRIVWQIAHMEYNDG